MYSLSSLDVAALRPGGLRWRSGTVAASRLPRRAVAPPAIRQTGALARTLGTVDGGEDQENDAGASRHTGWDGRSAA